MLPPKYQGLGLPNYTLERLILKVNFLQKHLGSKSLPGEMLKQEYEAFQIEVGLYSDILKYLWNDMGDLARKTHGSRICGNYLLFVWG